jgi:hypothetical protein
MKVEMQDRVAFAAEKIRRGERMELAMKARQRARVRPKAPRAPPEGLEHRRPIDPLEREIRTAHVDDARRGISAVPNVSHDRDLALGHGAAAVAPQHARFIDCEDVGVLAARDQTAGQAA